MGELTFGWGEKNLVGGVYWGGEIFLGGKWTIFWLVGGWLPANAVGGMEAIKKQLKKGVVTNNVRGESVHKKGKVRNPLPTMMLIWSPTLIIMICDIIKVYPFC